MNDTTGSLASAIDWLGGQFGFDLMTSPVGGIPADDPERHGDIEGVARAVGTALRDLHAIDPTGSPLPTGWEDLAELVDRVSTTVDSSSLQEPYCRYTSAELLSLWREGRPDQEDLVVCLGNAGLQNFLVENGALVGVVVTDHVRIADRHLDLAFAHQSLQRTLGGEAVFQFYEAYGTEPSLVALDHYVLASQLLGFSSEAAA